MGLRGAVIDVTERHFMEEALRASLAESGRHVDQMTTLEQMNDLLLSCATQEEAYTVIASSAERLFAPHGGGLAMGSADGATLRLAATWGQPSGWRAEFPVQDCWALRRGEPHEIIDPASDAYCRHCQREAVSVAMLDLDHFKRFNDRYGHEAGDRVLQAVSALLGSVLRSSDIACRYGGEELTLILPGFALDMARARLEELRRAVMELYLPYRDGELPAVTVSIGLTVAEPGETDADVLIGRADAALYRAKQQGRNCVVVLTAADRVDDG